MLAATISKWKQARDGSITGVISGSNSFGDGDPVTTSPIVGKAVGGTVVRTKSGSRSVQRASTEFPDRKLILVSVAGISLLVAPHRRLGRVWLKQLPTHANRPRLLLARRQHRPEPKRLPRKSRLKRKDARLPSSESANKRRRG